MNTENASPEQIEQNIVQLRSQISHTLDAVQDKLSPGQLLDQALSYAKNGSGEVASNVGRFSSNFGRVVRDNPLPVALFGIGLAWLMVSNGRSGSEGGYSRGRPYPSGPATEPDIDHPGLREQLGYNSGGTGSSAGAAVGEAARSVGSTVSEKSRRGVESVSHGYESASDRASAAANKAGAMTQQAGAKLSQIGSTVGERAERMRTRAGTAFEETRTSVVRAGTAGGEFVKNNPLAVAAMAMATGAVIAAFLPRTRQEDETLGRTSDEVKSKAKETATEGARRVAEEATYAAGSAAENLRRREQPDPSVEEKLTAGPAVSSPPSPAFTPNETKEG